MRKLYLLCGCAVILVASAASADESVIYSLPAGSRPVAQLAQDPTTGNLYGASYSGGSYSWGFAFRVKERRGAWKGAPIFSFDLSNGAHPAGPLTFDKTTGTIYGTTLVGGTYNRGTVFSLAPEGTGWNENVLYSFTGDVDGADPEGQLSIDSDTGALYGTASSNASGNPSGCGNIFELSNSGGPWSFTPLYEFQGDIDGCAPKTGPRPGVSPDTLFGTTEYTVYKADGSAGTWTEQVIDGFPTISGGQSPSDIDVVSDELIYGTAFGGGRGNSGVVFELQLTRKGWKETVLYKFRGGSDGSGPVGLRYEKSTDSLYGTTQSGGDFGKGTLFQMTHVGTVWTEAVLHSFGATGDGANPAGRPIPNRNTGALFGTTLAGGKFGGGAVYSYTP
ncbi:MAG TPA: choice-of-anchor tandem repeat GloVer-containing protein [Rhizomicrobium sp.]|jgi:uncharacterized repeat protein (TIGR03803 family)